MNTEDINESVFQENFFHAIPGQVDSFLLRDYYQKKMLDSLRIYLVNISTSMRIDLSLQIAKIDQLDWQRRFSPSLYTLYVQIKDAYEKKTLDGILDGIQLLNNEPSESLYADYLQYSTILAEIWERPFLREIRETILVAHGTKSTPRLDVFPLVHWAKDDFPPPVFYRSLDLLKTLDHSLFLEVQSYVSRIKFFSSNSLNSVTSPRYFGAIYMRLPFAEEDQETFFLDTLVHETSHLHLFAIMDRNILILNDEQDLYSSPLKRDKRPMIGVFHAAFVLSRMVRILRCYCNAYPNKEYAKNLLEEREKRLEKGMSTISTEAQLTKEGKKLFDTLAACATMKAQILS